MKQVVATNRGEVRVREAPMPELAGSGAIVRTVCSVFGAGSELGHLRGLRAAARREPIPDDRVVETPMSYQSCGRIVEVSPDLRDRYAVGDLVACAGIGFGHHAEYGYTPKNTMARVPEGVTAEEAATCNVGLTALHSLRRGGLQAGELIAVVGLGLVGQLIAQLAAAIGGRAVGSDLFPLRLEAARRCGIEAAYAADERDAMVEGVRARTGGHGADVSALCITGGTDLVHHAVRLVRPSGVVLMIGGMLHPDFKGATGDANPHVKEIDLRWISGRGPGSRDPDWSWQGLEYPRRFLRWTAATNLEALLHLQATGRVKAAPLLSHRFPVDRAAEAADLLVEHPEQALGVVLTYGAP
jgi:threonine dehydrogenase-like Zn-dependent dehydrogenase